MLGEDGGLVVLALWPVLALIMFSRSGAFAALVTLLGGMLLLPEGIGFDLSGFPTLTKRQILSLSALAGMLFFHLPAMRKAKIGQGPELLVLLMIPISYFSIASNQDSFGTWVWYPAMRNFDILGMVFEEFVLLGIPFVVGRTFFRRREDLELLLRALVVSALAYSVLVLIEIRMSPQMNMWVYGYGQHSWFQVMRFGGWRPMVFMAHGLALTLFMGVGALAAVVSHRARLPVYRRPAGPFAAYLAVVVLLCRSLGSITYVALLAPLLIYARARTMGRVAALMGIFILAYPTLRTIDQFPTDSLLNLAGSVSEERKASLKFRFDAEDAAIARVMMRPAFGWGGYGRARFIDDRWNPEIVVDGFWMIRMGEDGIAGLAVFLVLLTWPLFRVAKAVKRLGDGREARMLGGLALIVGLYGIDLLPNGLFTHFPLVLGGAATSLATGLVAARSKKPVREIEPESAEPVVAAPAGALAAGPTTRDMAKMRPSSSRTQPPGAGTTRDMAKNRAPS